MNFKRIGRILVCLVLVCCLIVNISPVRAEAASIVVPTIFGAVTVDAGSVALAALAGLGIAAGSQVDDWNALADNVVNAWKESGVLDENGCINLYSMGSDLYGIDASTLQNTFDWVYDNGVLSDSAIATNAYTIYNPLFSGDSTYSYSCDVPFAPCWGYYTYGGFEYVFELFVAKEQCTIKRAFIGGTSSSSTSITLSSQYGGYYYFGSSGLKSNYDMTDAGGIYLGEIVRNTYEEWSTQGISNYCEYAIKYLSDKFGFVSTPSTSQDLTLYDIAPAGSTLADGYSAWTANAVSGTNETGESVLVYPIGSASLGDEELVYTQEEVQAGTVPFVIVIDQTETGGGETEPTEPDTGEGTVVPTDPITPFLLERLFGGVQEKLDLTYVSIQEIPELLKEFMLDVKTGFIELPGKFAEWFTKLQETLEKLLSGQITLADLLAGIVDPIITAIKTALTSIFAPSETFIATKVNELCAKYPYLDTFLGLGSDLKGYLLSLGTKAPIIYIDLGAATGSYYFGGQEVFLDLTWYAEYKSTVDNIIGGFIWLWLAWRVFLSLPSLIQGGNGFWGEHKTDIGAGSTVNPTIVHQRELPSGRGSRRNE